MTEADRALLTRSARGSALLSAALLSLASGGFVAAGWLGSTLTAHRGQALLPAAFAVFLLALRYFVARDPGRRRDVAGGHKVVLRAAVESVSAAPSRGQWVVRLQVAGEVLKMYRRKAPAWKVGDLVEVHFAPHSRDVLWAAQHGAP
ncbi:MAG: hypothetical protein FJ255_13060 [Phycisphaerae bacterium]|nr:hypothetical protein [Phycisphaerae bacterium]